MRIVALALTGLMFTGLVVATVYVVAGDLVRDLLDKADPMAAFTDALQEEVDELLARAEWLRDRPDFARWDQEMKS